MSAKVAAGTSSLEHLEENMVAASLRLTEQEFRELAGVPELTFSK
jgi:aryl-alcohol dehydrogenase-like predicted oxidoreductase